MLDKDFDHSKTYYKVLNEKENHKGFQYHDGLNILDKEFDEADEPWLSDGMHFTDVGHLPLFFNYGDHIREIKIPEDASMVRDENKWRTDKMILVKRITKDEYFETLWDPNKFDWEDSNYLAMYCFDYFETWWDPDKFKWNHSWALIKYCSKHFETWWDPDKFNWVYSGYLPKYASEHFDKWWDPDQFNWYSSEKLFQFCSDYQHIWSKDSRLKN